MAQWTSAVGAAQLARLLSSQQDRPAGPGTRRPPRLSRACRRHPAARAGGPRAGRRAPARGTRTGPGPRGQPDHRRRRLRGTARRGVPESRRGAGSWTAVPAGNPIPARGLEPLPPESLGSMIDLGCASLSAPEPWLTRAVQGALEELPPYAHTHGDYPAGLPALRAMIAERYTARGIPTMPEQIMVTTGAMGAIDAICHLFAGRGERIAVESPSYANILQLMREAGARLVPRRDGRGPVRLGHGPLAPGPARGRAADRLCGRRLPQPHRGARRRGPAAPAGGRGPFGGHGAGRRRDDDRAVAGRGVPGRRDAPAGVRGSTRPAPR